MSEGSYASQVMRAWAGELPFAELIDTCSALDRANQSPLSALLYQTWVARTPSPLAHAVNFNLGTTLSNLGELDAAERAYLRAIELAPAFLHPRLNLGLLYERRGQPTQAIEQWQWVADNGVRDETGIPLITAALNHLGRIQETQKQYQQAVDNLTQSLHLNPDQPDVLHHWVFMRQRMCAWPVYAEVAGVAKEAMRQATSALAMIALSDDPQAQLLAAQTYVRDKVANDVPRLAPDRPYGHDKIRIAYCSSDFCLHPVSLLTVQLFELHDRSKFEIYGYCWSPEDGSAMRQRVISAMDHFHKIHHLSDEEAARLIRSHEIDILIDLQGQTAGARANMLAYRPAPVQITYLGLPATTGLPSIDYVIADRFLIPPDAAGQYTEKPLYMPHVYQVSDRLRIEGPTPTRAMYGLPEDKFVFCSFNNSYKYTAEIFEVWLRILQRTPQSVLWLLADNPWQVANLRERAAQAGIGPERLIFADRVSPENYLARFQLADLFLDTFPFNAGTTANDCLWMGCPILTLSGRSFASRMAGALLHAAELPELVTENLPDYEEAAVNLAHQPERCRRLRDHLQQVRAHGKLFDTPQFARDLEQRLWQLAAP